MQHLLHPVTTRFCEECIAIPCCHESNTCNETQSCCDESGAVSTDRSAELLNSDVFNGVNLYPELDLKDTKAHSCDVVQHK
nr:hypothetical protein CFP56_21358 [Quercus suber]